MEVSVSMNNPKLNCDVNLMGLINLLDSAVTCGVKKLLMPSLAAIYGNLDTLPLDESMIGIPNSFYGLTKLTTEYYPRIYYEVFGLNYICYRYSNVYGPRQGNGSIASSINLIINEFKCISNSKIDVSYEPERIGDIRHSRLDNKKAQKDLSFKTTFNLRDGLFKTYEYFKNNE